VPSAGKYVIGTVKGDLHDIGKNLVKMMAEGAGFEVIDLGTQVRRRREGASAQTGGDERAVDDDDGQHEGDG
jgi:methylmalonyl-CoA mutase cobalamin-binding subunit